MTDKIEDIKNKVAKCEQMVLILVKKNTHTQLEDKGILFICSAVLNRKPLKRPHLQRS